MDEVGADKLGHSVAGTAIYSLARMTALAAGMEPEAAMWVGVGAALLIGAAKEAWDAQGHGTPETADFIATAGGAVLGLSAGIKW